MTFLWYIPNQVAPGHRGDDTVQGHNSLDRLTELARLAEDHGWGGALLGTGWGRPDTFTVATALAARTTTFQPLVAIRPGYWQPAHFASAAGTLDQLTGGRLLINIVSGQDNLAAYGDSEGDQAQRYARTREFLQLVRRLVDRGGRHLHRRPLLGHRVHGRDASRRTRRAAASAAVLRRRVGGRAAGRCDGRRRAAVLGRAAGRDRRADQPAAGAGVRARSRARTARVRPADHHARPRHHRAGLGRRRGQGREDGRGARVSRDRRWFKAVGQQRLLELAERGEVLDDNLYTAPGKYGGGGAGTTWLVGSADDVAKSLRKYQDLGITHFILSDTPYREETVRVGDQLLPLLKNA